MIYKRRVVDIILKYFDTDNIIVLHGARQVGKTNIMLYLIEHLNKNNQVNFYLDLEDYRNLEILNLGVDEFIKHLKEKGVYNDKRLYVFIDEIQYLDNPSSFLKLIADHHKNIRLIVSCSSSFEIKSKFKDSLVGRTVNFEIYPLDFDEFLYFKGYKVDLSSKELTNKTLLELTSYFKEYTLNGGYPKITLTDNIEFKEKYITQIIGAYIKKDIRDLGKIKDIDKFNKLLELLASQSGNLVNISELSNTLNIHKQTVEKYLFLLENTYIIRLVNPFYSNLRNELFKTPKIFFIDTGIMNLLWMKSLPKEILGNIFETCIFSEYLKSNIFQVGAHGFRPMHPGCED
ncbi:MAG: ATP-binding protein, partial [Candidatus Absconditabacteria bacterium]